MTSKHVAEEEKFKKEKSEIALLTHAKPYPNRIHNYKNKNKNFSLKKNQETKKHGDNFTQPQNNTRFSKVFY